MTRLKASIDWDWVEKELFSKERIDKSKDISKCARSCMKTAPRLCKARVAASEFGLAGADDIRIKLNDGSALGAPKISDFLKDADSIVAAAVTIGPGIEREAARFMKKGDILSGYIIDRIGSYAVESLMGSFERALREKMSEEKKSVSVRFSPGYCDWSVEEQRKIVKMTGASRIGIKLTESFMMSPKKSITAVMGIGPIGLFKSNSSQCSRCGMKDCGYRR